MFGAQVSNEIIDLVYAELRKQAHSFLARERRGHTLQTTALVNETYVKLERQKKVTWESRSHFFAIAATMMRRILVDYARAKRREKRGGPMYDLSIEAASEIAARGSDLDLIDLDQALGRLAEKDERLARIVELKFFSGLDLTETAEAMNLSESTVKRDWRMAKAWLRRELSGQSDE
jgi:RNA polymerase sigma factor, TIGR02999 family